MSNQENYWLKIAQYDLDTADSMLKAGRYLYVGFMCHQAIEKLLKGIYSNKFNSVPPRIHNLARLLKLVDLDKEIPLDLLEFLNELNPLNIATRYPDEDLDFIKEIGHNYATTLLKNSGRLFTWLKSKLA
ncbi:MAG TPA: HEPN domain-containing protein [Defluviitaleaceae bacterium]|nr:HEPN domain-containing protein [Defluviitaleaceae bacterium]